MNDTRDFSRAGICWHGDQADHNHFIGLRRTDDVRTRRDSRRRWCQWRCCSWLAPLIAKINPLTQVGTPHPKWTNIHCLSPESHFHNTTALCTSWPHLDRSPSSPCHFRATTPMLISRTPFLSPACRVHEHSWAMARSSKPLDAPACGCFSFLCYARLSVYASTASLTSQPSGLCAVTLVFTYT